MRELSTPTIRFHRFPASLPETAREDPSDAAGGRKKRQLLIVPVNLNTQHLRSKNGTGGRFPDCVSRVSLLHRRPPSRLLPCSRTVSIINCAALKDLGSVQISMQRVRRSLTSCGSRMKVQRAGVLAVSSVCRGHSSQLPRWKQR